MFDGVAPGAFAVALDAVVRDEDRVEAGLEGVARLVGDQRPVGDERAGVAAGAQLAGDREAAPVRRARRT